MATVAASQMASALENLRGLRPNGETPLLGSGVTERATSPAPMNSGLDQLDPRRDTIDRWSAALARGDDAEVDRLVRRSRMDRVLTAATGQLGTMLGGADPIAGGGLGSRQSG